VPRVEGAQELCESPPRDGQRVELGQKSGSNGTAKSGDPSSAVEHMDSGETSEYISASIAGDSTSPPGQEPTAEKLIDRGSTFTGGDGDGDGDGDGKG